MFYEAREGVTQMCVIFRLYWEYICRYFHIRYPEIIACHAIYSLVINQCNCLSFNNTFLFTFIGVVII